MVMVSDASVGILNGDSESGTGGDGGATDYGGNDGGCVDQ